MKKLSNPVHNDHLEEITRRLPMKQLAQCKIISKYWNNVISRPRFSVQGRPNRTLLNYQAGIMLVYPRHQGGESISFAKPWYLGVRVTLNTLVVGTCDGLICFSSTKTGTYASVFNPLLKEGTQTCHFDEPIRNASYFFGFGFDVVNNYYKIVKITQSKKETYIEIHNLYTKVSSLSSNQVSFQLTSVAPVTVNGHSHWIGVNLQNHKLEIVRFDFGDEKFVNVPFSNNMPNINYSSLGIVCEQPNTEVTDSLLLVRRIQKHKQPKTELEVEGLKFRLGVFKGSVCLIVTYSTKVEVWCMEYKENCTSWNKQFEIELRPHPAKEVIGFTANDELVIGYNRDDSFHYCAWNPWTKQPVFPIGIGHFWLNQVVTYEESLVSVKLKPPTP